MSNWIYWVAKQLRNTNAIVQELKDKEPDEPVGMLTKNANCASCERNITNLLDGKADHQNWKRLPFREPNERIARVSYLLTHLAFSQLTMCTQYFLTDGWSSFP